MATANFNIKPEDGWTLVVTGATSQLHIRSVPDGQDFFVTNSASLPAATVVGFKAEGGEFTSVTPTTDNVYVRIAPTSRQNIRVDVYYETGASSGGGSVVIGQVTTTPITATYTSRSGTITTGGTSQTLMAANAARKGFMVQNRSAESLFINTLAAAANDNSSIELLPGQMFIPPAVPLTDVRIIGATTGSAFFAREW